MEVFLGITVGLCFGFFIIAVFSAGFAFIAYSKVVGFENSTHQVQYLDPHADSDSPQERGFPREEEEDMKFPMPMTPKELLVREVAEEKENKKFEEDARKSFGYTEEEQDSII